MAYSAMSKMSARMSGSPPVRIRIGLANEAIWSTSLNASAVLSSPSYGPWTAEARQWTQARLQLRVTSQAMTRGGATPSPASPGRVVVP